MLVPLSGKAIDMDIDELIDKALNSGSGFLDPTNLYGLVGDPTTNEVLVLSLADFFIDNFRHFVLGEGVSLILLGAYNSEQAAREAVLSVRETDSLNPVGLVGSADWYVLIADTIQNRLFSIPLTDYYTGYFALFRFKAEAALGKVVLNIFGTQDAADECAEVIRMYIKDETGNVL